MALTTSNLLASLIESPNLFARFYGYLGKLLFEWLMAAVVAAVIGSIVLLLMEGTSPFRGSLYDIRLAWRVSYILISGVFLRSLWCLTTNPGWRPTAPSRI